MNGLWLIFLAGAAAGFLAGIWLATAWIARHDHRSAVRLLGLMPKPGAVEAPVPIPNPAGRAE